MSLSPWHFEWTIDNTKQFWNAYGRATNFQDRYFSHIAGQSVVKLLKRYLSPGSAVIDYGAGVGDLTYHLLKNNYKTLAVDGSQESIGRLTEKLSGHPNLLGARVLGRDFYVAPSSFDAVLLVEVIEHLETDVLDNVLASIYKVLKPGGLVLITTPNQEDLESAKHMCPNCGCIFHPVQHLHSFTRSSLVSTLQDHSYRLVCSRSTYFSHLNGYSAYLDKIRRFLGPDPWPHLYAIARRLP